MRAPQAFLGAIDLAYASLDYRFPRSVILRAFARQQPTLAICSRLEQPGPKAR
jgi:hypothetical protein